MDIYSIYNRLKTTYAVSNGTLIDESLIPKLAELDLLSVGFSIDGDEETHDRIRGIPGAYRKTIHSATELKRQRVRLGKKRPIINFKSVISESNAGSLEKIYQAAADVGADYCTFQIQNNSMYLSALRLSEDTSPYQQAPDPIQEIDLAQLRNPLDGYECFALWGRIPMFQLPDWERAGDADNEALESFPFLEF